ncbi:MAG: hypothetical protein GTO02_05860 [Candidatus Dadabacteria bacterium]|nr:hypothetical protein [Candidatus Dadabacteria bacterium]
MNKKMELKTMVERSLKLIFISILTWIIPATIFAHGPLMGKGFQEEEKKGPNGGQVVEFDKNHLEFLVDHKDGGIFLFLLDEKRKNIQMPKTYSALMFLRLADSKGEWFKFNYVEKNTVSYLKSETGINDIGSFSALVGFKHNNQTRNFNFKWSSDEHTNH